MFTVTPVLATQKGSNLIKSFIKALIPNTILKHLIKFKNKDTSTRIYFEDNLVTIDKKSIQGATPLFYWDGVPNFGDTIGPYLVSKITKKPVFNILNKKVAGFMAVGSILQLIDRKNMVVWGSGLIDEPSDELIKDLKKYKPKILSLRGKQTAKFLRSAGIDIPDENTYGDPALALPRFYQPKITQKRRIGLCPHYIHKHYFLSDNIDNEKFNIIDVQLDMKNVINQICSSDVCVSTSLHGLIIAQAYNIPWVWLEICDENLAGNDFKFKDFFSTIDQNQVSHVKTTLAELSNLDFEVLAKGAYLPDKLYNEDKIIKALENYLFNFSN